MAHINWLFLCKPFRIRAHFKTWLFVIIPHTVSSASLGPEHVFKRFIESFRGCSGFQNELRLWLQKKKKAPTHRKVEINRSGPSFFHHSWCASCTVGWQVWIKNKKGALSIFAWCKLQQGRMDCFNIPAVSFTVFLFPPHPPSPYWCSLIWQLKRIEIEAL